MILSGWSVGFSRRSVRGEYQSMRSALRASAPSHPLHVMPPRITRNSDRPRASDRTMVDPPRPRSACQVSRLDWRRHRRKMKPRGRTDKPEQNPSRRIGGTYRQWAGCRDKNLLGLRSREKFFLDIPFYRTLTIWKKGVGFDAKQLHRQAA